MNKKTLGNKAIAIWITFLFCATLFVAVSVPTASADPIDNCILHFKLNEGSSNIVTDSSGGGYNGERNGDLGWTTGKVGASCLDLDGMNDYAYTTSTSIGDFSYNHAFSGECWIKGDTTDGYNGLMCKFYTTDYYGWSLAIDGTGKVMFWLGKTGNKLSVSTTSATCVDGQWNHIAFTYNGNTHPSGVHIYINGSDKTLTTWEDTLLSGTSYAEHFKMGTYYGGSADFHGFLDEVVVYSDELTPTEVTYRYNGGTGTESLGITPASFTFGTPSPVNGSTNIALTHTLAITLYETHGYGFTYQLWSNKTGTWVKFSQNTVSGNSTVVYLNDNTPLYGHTYYWRVNAINGTVNTSRIFHFTTIAFPIPTITNIIPTNGSTCVDVGTSSWSVDVSSLDARINYSSSVVGTSPTYITQYTTGTSGSMLYGNAWRSESFPTSVGDHITQVGIKAKRVGTGTLGNVVVSLYGTATTFDGYIPSGSALATTTVSGSAWSTSYEWHNISFNYTSTLTRYAIVVSAPTGTSSNYLYWSLIAVGTYADGNFATSSNSGTTWTAVTVGVYDSDFRVYYNKYDTVGYSNGFRMGNGSIGTSLNPPMEIGYTYRVDLNVSSENSASNITHFTFTTGDNSLPYYTQGSISNGSTGVSVAPHWNIYLGDNQSDLDWSIECGAFSNSGISSPSGNHWLNMTGLLFLTSYNVYVNVTDEGGSSCPAPLSKSWVFHFTTVDANSPYINFSVAPSDPVSISNPDHMYVNYSVKISDPAGLVMSYKMVCDNGDSKIGSGVHNSTIWINLTTGIAISTTYTIYVNVSNGVKYTNNTDSFLTRSNAVIVLGTPSPANNSVGVTIGGGWTLPFTDSDGSDTITISAELSNGDFYHANITAPNTILLAYHGLSYSTLYTVWVNTTDEWGGVVDRWYSFTTAPYSMGGTPYMVYNANMTFSFSDSNGTGLDFSSLSFSSWLYNSSDITMMDYYVHDGDLTINFTTLMVFEAFTIDFLVDTSLVYTDYSNSFLCGDGSSFSIVLIKRITDYTFANSLNRTWTIGDYQSWIGLETDHKEYYSGQDIVFRYRLPPTSWWTSAGQLKTDYSLYMHKDPKWIWTWWNPPVTDSVWRNPSTGLTLDYGQWITMILDSSTFTGGYPVVDTEYRINLGKDGWWILANDIPTLNGLSFTLLSVPLTPSGSFTGLPSPVSPDVGTTVTFVYTANNRGQIEIDDLLKTGATELYPFEVTDLVFTHEFNIPSVYRINLQVWSGSSYVTVDTINTFYVNSTTNATIGYNVEYLDPERKMIVAGLHPLEFVYSSLRSPTTSFIIKNPDGETTRYSTVISSPAKGMYSHNLPSTAPIGRWNVTMIANDTFSFSFDVVADENNFIDFIRPEYTEGDQFQVYVVHDVKVLLIFKKADSSGNYVAKGSKVFIEQDVPDGLITIEHITVEPSSGNWKVEMWECDNRIEIRKLAEYYCTVLVSPVDVPIVPPSGTILPKVEGTLGFIIGFIITLFCLLIPFIVSKALGGTIDVPAIVYAFTCGLGLVISVALGFFPVWVLAFLLVVGVIIMVILYLMGKTSSNGV